MKNKNIWGLVLAVILSKITAPYFGGFYNKFYPQSGDWIYSVADAISFAGFLIAYIFFIFFVFEIINSANKKKWFFGSLLPVFVFYLIGGINFLYFPVLVGLVGFVLAFIIRKIVAKIRRPNLPMVIK